MNSRFFFAMMMAASLVGSGLATSCSDSDNDPAPAPIDMVCGVYKSDSVFVNVANSMSVRIADFSFKRGNPSDAADKTFIITGSVPDVPQIGTLALTLKASVVQDTSGAMQYPYGDIVYEAQFRSFAFSIADQPIDLGAAFGGTAAFSGFGYAAAYSMNGAIVGKDMRFEMKASVQVGDDLRLVEINVVFPALANAEQERQ